MGHLSFGTPPESVSIDDRVLAHLKVVMLTKLRRHEGFAFSYDYDLASGGGRATVWLSPSVVIQFRFEGSRPPAINKRWLDALILTTNELDGLRIIPEPDESWEPPTTTGTIPVQK